MTTKTVFRRIDYGVCHRCHAPATVLRVRYRKLKSGAVKSAQLTTCCEKHSGKPVQESRQ